PPRATLFPYTTLFRSVEHVERDHPARAAAALDGAVHLAEEQRGVRRAVVGRLARVVGLVPDAEVADAERAEVRHDPADLAAVGRDRKSTRLNSSHSQI